MTTHKEWLRRWANRWVEGANAEIQRRWSEIADLRGAVCSATEPEERDWYESLIEEHEDVIDSIRQSHRSWRRRAKRRWDLQMPDLEESSP